MLASATRVPVTDRLVRDLERDIRQIGLGFRLPDLEALTRRAGGAVADPVVELFA